MKSSRVRNWERTQRSIAFGASVSLWGLGLFAMACSAEPDGASVGAAEPAQAESAATGPLMFQSSVACGATTKACTDIWGLEFPSNTSTEVTIKLARVGSSPIRLGVFPPGVSVQDGTNILTGGPSDLKCSSEPKPIRTFRTTAIGVYNLAVSRDPTPTVGPRGDYEIHVTANNTMNFLNLTSNDIQTSRSATCGFAQRISGSWNCARGVHCQDVYDVEMLGNSLLNVLLQPTGGGTAGRLAVFEQFTPLNGKNLLVNTNKDKNCALVSHTETGSIIVTSGGHYKFAFGRDGTLSTSAIPTGYTAKIEVQNPRSNTAFVPTFVGRIVNDQASQAAGIQCNSSP